MKKKMMCLILVVLVVMSTSGCGKKAVDEVESAITDSKLLMDERKDVPQESEAVSTEGESTEVESTEEKITEKEIHLKGEVPAKEETDSETSYKVFYPTCDADMIWNPQATVISEKVLLRPALDAAVYMDNPVYTFNSEYFGEGEEYAAPKQLENNGETFIITREFYASWNDYSNGRTCYELYNMNDGIYYYALNTLSTRSDDEHPDGYYPLWTIE